MTKDPIWTIYRWSNIICDTDWEDVDTAGRLLVSFLYFLLMSFVLFICGLFIYAIADSIAYYDGDVSIAIARAAATWHVVIIPAIIISLLMRVERRREV